MGSKLLVYLVWAVFLVNTVCCYTITWTGSEEGKINETPKPLLGSKSCTFGPSYWCHNITQARECHATRHCIEKVWEHMKLPEDNDSVCKICLDMVGQARDQLLSNETQTELREVLEGSCNLLPLRIIRKECINLADEYIPDLVDALTSRMDPQAVCAVSGLCNSDRIDEMLGERKSLEPAAHEKFDLKKDSCPKCNHFMGEAISFLKSLPESELMDKLYLLCGRLGSYSDSCIYMVEENMEKIYLELQTQVESKDLCNLLGLCDMSAIHKVSIGGGFTAVRAWSPPVNDENLPCDFCKQMVVHTRDWLLANTTRDEFRDLIIGMCKRTGKYRKECLDLARQYGKFVYQLLVDESDPDRVCGTIGVCPGSSKFQLFHYDIDHQKEHNDDLIVVHAVQLLPAEKLSGDDEVDSSSSSEESFELGRFTGDEEAKQKVKGKAECQFCEFALHELLNYMTNPRTEEEVIEAMDKLCTEILPQEMAEQCTDYVDAYGKSMIAMLTQEVDPDQICPMIGACPKKMLIGGTEKAETPLVRVNHKPKAADIPTCPLCHYAVAKVIHMIGENRTKAAIDDTLDSVCYVMPHTIKKDCLNFMTYYGNQIGEMLVINLSAREICMALGLCVLSEPISTSPVHPHKIVVIDPLPAERYVPTIGIDPSQLSKLKEPYTPVQEVRGPSQQCVICEFAISQITKRLENNATEEEIRTVVEEACDYLPKTVQAQCKDFVDAYSDMIVNYLANSLDPAQVCTELGLCKPHNKTVAVTPPELKGNVNMGRCQLCVVVSDYLSAMLEDPKVETSVDSIVEKICPVMPKKYQAECKTMIEEYGPYLMSLLAQGADKGRACSILSMCPAEKP